MEASEGGSTDVVHPEVRAHITSLVSALGGFSADDDGRYVLGDSALEVLRDIKKWIRFYDEKTNRMDVARCLADANLIDGDLLHILATWPENANDNKFKARVALACFEILVPLTWPLDRNREEMTVNHHRHIPVLQLAQLAYKRSIINFDAAQILHTAVRVALSSLAIPRNERSTRDEGIIKLVLLFLRNVAMISPPPGVTYDGDESQISRSALIDAFSYQDILLTILTIASNMGEDFNQEGLVVMEIIFHLVKRVNISQLFMDDKQVGKAKSDELATLMQKEAAMHRSQNRKAPTRHSRWGSMLWVKRDDGKVSTVSGQDALVDAATREQKMDSNLGPRTSLNSRARGQLRSFVEEFLDSGFNPLFMHVRKKLDEQKDYVFEYHHRQFFYLTSWFLEAERVRQKVAAKKGKKDQSNESDVGTFNLVASVLNQETFITLNRAMGDSMENKNWPELSAAMRCFTQILLTVQEMTETGNEEDEEIAENILGRIFYENETHERIATIARNFKDQGFEFLDACTELTHTYLRVLEAYSKQNVDMQVRSRRRTRKNKKAASENGENPVEEEDESENDQASAEKTSTERKFQFGTFTNKFTQQGVVDTFVHFTKFCHDLNDSQLKRAHRYFYRIAFKQNMSVMLFRVDIIHLFYNIIKGQEPLDKQCSVYKEWDELVKQILKKCIRKIEERPALLIEMLFSKINATAHYLEYGYEKQTISSSKPRSAAELEFRHIVDHDQQVAIVVGVLLDNELSHHIKWVKSQLAVAETERRAWETAEKAMPSVETKAKDTTESAGQNEEDGLNENGPAKEPPPIFVRPDDDARRTAMFKNSHLRLLMKLVGFQRLDTAAEETPKSDWIVPSSYTADQLQESIDLINKAEFDPPTFEDGALAENQLRRKTAPRKKAVFDEDENDGDEDENLFPAGGPTARKVVEENGAKPRKIRKRRRRASNSEPLDDEELEEKARKRREREKEKARRFKSDVYVHASDDETDEERDREFFANEELLRQKQKALVISTINKAPLSSPPPKATSVKRKAQVLLDNDSENDDLPMTQDSATSSRGRRVVADDDDDEDEDGASTSGTEDTPLSSGGGSPAHRAKKRRLRMAKEPGPARPEPEDLAASLGLAVDTEMADADDDEEEEDVVPKQAPRRRARGKAGFIIDSSDEE
ncbi:hypothetical protein PG994_009165 [Apiospora phragmitis]|uniref:Topoisomerase 1-associated factor 1 n=1 Tax=Apiospora phragmitis TaxID=2905665 RepID=A0ABR1UJ21_9PEZI